MYLLENIFSVYLLRTTPMEMAQHDRTDSWKIMVGNCVWQENIPLHLGSPRRHYYIFKTTSQHSSMPPEHITVSNITANIFLNHSMTLWLQEHNLCVTGIYRLLKTMRTAPSWLSQSVLEVFIKHAGTLCLTSTGLVASVMSYNLWDRINEWSW